MPVIIRAGLYLSHRGFYPLWCGWVAPCFGAGRPCIRVKASVDLSRMVSGSSHLRRRALHTIGGLCLLGVWLLLMSACSAEPSTPSGTTEELARAKLAEEIRKLRFDTARAASGLGVALAAAPFVTVLVAIATFGAALFKQFGDREAQRNAEYAARDKDRQQREDQQNKDRQQREDQQNKDRQQRFDEQFMTAAAQVGAAEEGLQAAGAASLLRLQDSASDALQREILLYCAAQLRIRSSPSVQPIIKEVFEAAVRRVSVGDPAIRPKTLNLAGADLTGIDLSNLDLRGVRVELTGANLNDANLSSADLWRVRADGATFLSSDCSNTNLGQASLVRSDFRRARLDGVRMSSANLRDADLSGATMRGARLQSAHFEGSVMNPTFLQRADINDTYFTGAHMDPATLHSLMEAKNRERAHGLPALDPLSAPDPSLHG